MLQAARLSSLDDLNDVIDGSLPSAVVNRQQRGGGLFRSAGFRAVVGMTVDPGAGAKGGPCKMWPRVQGYSGAEIIVRYAVFMLHERVCTFQAAS